jgi:hypothetical protein
MNEPQSHFCRIIDLGSGARAAYVIRNVRAGDVVDLRLKVDDPYDSSAVAAYHKGHHIGYVAPGGRWLVAYSLEQGDRHEAVVSDFETDARDNLIALGVEITVLPAEANGHPAPPAPGTAPWAPEIVHAPRPRWPVIIPLGLLAGLVLGAWLLVDRGFLPTLGRLAGGP